MKPTPVFNSEKFKGPFTTMDYDKFRYFPENRKIAKEGAEKIVGIMQDYSYIPSCPMLVTEPKNRKVISEFETKPDKILYVIDGQHRLEAAKKLNIEVIYWEFIGSVTEAHILMQRLNASQRKWIPDDYINFYARKGYPAYVTFLEYRKKYHLNGPTNTLILATDTIQSSGHPYVTEGKLVLSENAEYRLEFAEKVNLDLPFNMHKEFAKAIRTLLKNEPSEKNLVSFMKNIMDIRESRTREQYLARFEKIINHRKRKENYFTIDREL